MNELKVKDLKEIKGGGGFGFGVAIVAGIIFLIGVVDGYVRPLPCH